MADTEYKLFVRNPEDTGWVNALRETNIFVEDPDGRIGSDRLDEALYEILDLIAQIGGGGPGYLGTRVEIYADDVDSTGSSDNTASLSTIGGASIVKNLHVGLGITSENDVNAVNFVATGDVGSATVTGAGTGDITGYINTTITGTLDALTLEVTNVNSHLIPSAGGTFDLGTALAQWRELFVEDIAVSGTVTGNVTGDLTGNVTGNLTGDLVAALTNAVDIAAVNIDVSGTVTTNELEVTSVLNNLISSTGGNLGASGQEWSNLFVTNVDATVVTVSTLNASTINASNFTGTFTGNLDGDVTGNVIGNVQGDLNGDLVKNTSPVLVTSNTNSTDPTTGAFVVQGGVGVAMDMFIGGDLNVAGTIAGDFIAIVPWGAVPEDLLPDNNSTWSIGSPTFRWLNVHADEFTGALTGDVTGNVTGDLTGNLLGASNTTQGNFTVGQNLTVVGDFSIGGSFTAPSASYDQLFVTGIQESTNKDDGALVVTQGGMGVEGNINAGGYIKAIGNVLGAELRSVSSLTLGDVAIPDDGSADGLGITLLGDSPKTILWNTTNDRWEFNKGVDFLTTGRIYNLDEIETTTVTSWGQDLEIYASGAGTRVVIDDEIYFKEDLVIQDGQIDYQDTGSNFYIQNSGGSTIQFGLNDGESGTSLSMIGNAGITQFVPHQNVKANLGTVSLSWNIAYTQEIFTNYIRGRTDGQNLFIGNAGTDSVQILDELIVDKKVLITNTANSGSYVDETASFATRGGASIAKALYAQSIISPVITATVNFAGELVGSVSGTGNTVEADTITASLGFIGNLIGDDQVQITNYDIANHNPSATSALGDGAVYIMGGTSGKETGASLSVNGNLFLGGDLFLDTSGRWLEDELDAREVENGFVDISQSTLSVDDTQDPTPTFTIAPTGADFTFYAGGVRYIKDVAQSVEFSPTEGLHYFYFDKVDGTLQTTTTFDSDIIEAHAFVSAVYWSVTANTYLTLAEERHGNTMSNVTHSYLHATQGTRLASGGALGLTPWTAGGAVDANLYVDVANLVMYDEDIRHVIENNNPQQIVGPAQLPVWYRDGVGSWNRQDSGVSDAPVIMGATRPQFNFDSGGGNWVLQEVPDTEFVCVHIVATNDMNEPMVAIVGQATYPDLNTAYEGGADEAGQLEFGDIGTLSPEWVFLGTCVIEVDETAYAASTYNSVFRKDVEGNDYIDLRGGKLSPSGGTTADDHSGLTNLQGGVFPNYYHSNQPINSTSSVTFADMTLTGDLLPEDSAAPFDTTPTVIDSFALATYRGMKYVITFEDRDNTEYYSVEMLVMHDGTTAYKNEYGVISTMTADPAVTVAVNGANVEVTVTAVAGADNVVSFQRFPTAVV